MTLPNAPVLLLQQGWRHRGDLQPVGDARVAAGEPPPGVLLSYEDVHLRGVGQTHAGVSPLAPILADPGGHKWGRGPYRGTIPFASWVARNAPSTSAEWRQTVDEALAEQRGLGVDALIAPGAALTAAAGTQALRRQLDAVRRAWANRPSGDPPWFVRICLEEEWLSTPALTTPLLNELTDLPDEIGVALHIRWSRVGVATDSAKLGNLKHVVSTLADDDRQVLMIQAGTVGWLAIGWGAWGLTAALSHQQGWLDTELQPFGRKKGVPSPPLRELYFDEKFIHLIPASDYRRLVGRQGYVACTCAFCQGLPASPGWDRRLSQQHGLYALTELTARVTSGNRVTRQQRVKREIANAEAAWTTLSQGAGLSSAARPRHLPIWDTLL